MAHLSYEDAKNMSALLVDLVREKIPTEDEAHVGVGVTKVFCEAMISLFPDLNQHGENICQVISKFVATYPRAAKGID